MIPRHALLLAVSERKPLAYRSKALSTNLTTLSKPSGVYPGDLVVILVPWCSTGVTLTTSSGDAWSRSEISWTSYGYFSVLFWKVMTATDVSNNWGLSEANDAQAVCWEPGASAVGSVSVATKTNNGGEATLVLPGVATDDFTKGAVAVVVDRDGGGVTPGAPAGFTSRAAGVLETFFQTAIADDLDYQGGDVTWTNVNGTSTLAEVGWLLGVRE